MASMNYFDSDMCKSTNTVVYFNGKDGNLYLLLGAMSHTIYAAKLGQTITQQYVRLRRESRSYRRSIRNNNIVFARFNCTSHILGHYQNTRTFPCSFFGDIKYFLSRFVLAV